jgi:hypothetical protein
MGNAGPFYITQDGIAVGHLNKNEVIPSSPLADMSNEENHST